MPKGQIETRVSLAEGSSVPLRCALPVEGTCWQNRRGLQRGRATAGSGGAWHRRGGIGSTLGRRCRVLGAATAELSLAEGHTVERSLVITNTGLRLVIGSRALQVSGGGVLRGYVPTFRVARLLLG